MDRSFIPPSSAFPSRQFVHIRSFPARFLHSPDEIFTVRGKHINNSEILYLSVDGENRLRIDPGDCVVISKDEKYVKFINFGSKNYYEKLNKKILGR